MFRFTPSVRLALVGVSACALAVTMSSTPALAAAPTSTPESEQCTLNVESGEMTCYDTYQELISDISGGAVTDVTSPDQVTDAVVEDIAAGSGAQSRSTSVVASPQATYILSILYDDNGYQPASLQLTASGQCDNNADLDWSFSSFAAGWNDRASSFRSFSQCETELWENTFTGAHVGPLLDSPYVGDAMNDRASSAKLY